MRLAHRARVRFDAPGVNVIRIEADRMDSIADRQSSHVALVRDGKEDVLRFGDDVAVNLRAELAPEVEAPLVFAGYGLSAPDAGHDDLAGLDLKGKVAVYIAGAPSAITTRPDGIGSTGSPAPTNTAPSSTTTSTPT